MTREILFRAKRMDNGEWIEGDLVTNYLPIPRICVPHESVAVQYLFEINPKTVGQFTGLTDKNGKKIFEGDIVSRESQMYFGTNYVDVVSWNNDYMAWHLSESGTMCDFSRGLSNYGKVIGNIHDNPELIKPEVEINV